MVLSSPVVERAIEWAEPEHNAVPQHYYQAEHKYYYTTRSYGSLHAPEFWGWGKEIPLHK